MINKNISIDYASTSNACNEIEHDVDFENRCGLLNWRPDCLQRLRSIYLFLLILCIVCIVQTATSAGYLSSQITTLERRFSLNSYQLGLIQSFFDVGFIVSVIFVGYFGGQGRIPFWIGFGMLVMSTGSFSFSLPEFVTKWNLASSIGDLNSDLCLTNNSVTQSNSCVSEIGSNWIVKFLFIIGQVLIGCGSSPILSLAPTYIDDHVSETLASPLIALMYASTALGPVIGFGLGALMLQYPANEGTYKGSKPGDYNWIGAWWMGYFCLGVLAASTVAFLFMFPRKVRIIKKTKMNVSALKIFKPLNGNKKSKHETQTMNSLMENQNNQNTEDQTFTDDSCPGMSESRAPLNRNDEAKSYGKNIKDLPKAIVSLARNKVYVVVCFGICFEMFLVNGFASFLPKYIEKEYKVSNITASLIAGGIIVPAGALGIIVGGIIMHRFQLSARRAVLFSVVCALLVLVCMILFFLLSCNNPQFAGINTPIYHNQTRSPMNISNVCNSGICSNKCNPNIFSPLCDLKSGVTFFSGCHAGCGDTTSDVNGTTFYRDCQCTALNASSPGSSSLLVGECPLKCNSLISFLVFLTMAIFLTGITQNPLFMVTMRSVAKHERSFALGFQYVILRILAYIPSPIIYGRVIDSACVHWKWVCGERGDCLVMDLKQLTYNLVGLSFGVKCGAGIFYILLVFVISKHSQSNDSRD